MQRDAVKTLVLPFDRQDLPLPTSSAKWLFLNAEPLEDSGAWADLLDCVQPFRPTFLQLQNLGYSATARGDADARYAGALVLTHRSKALNQQMTAMAAKIVISGGTIIIAGEKTSGIVPLRKWVAKSTEIIDNFSKHHAQAFIFNTSDKVTSALAAPLQPLAGTFGAGKIDKGSALLASLFDESLTGEIADFCAGTGYLADQAIQKAAPTSVTLYEAEFAALEQARKNLEGSEITTSFHWHDLASEPVIERFDHIIMNPPFHTGRKSEPQLGQTMIQAAKRALRPSGSLLLVANRQLPYENTLKSEFGGFKELIAQDGFKVLRAHN